MQVTVKLFATLRQDAGWDEKPMEIAEDATIGDLLRDLTAAYPALRLTERAVYAAVNLAYVQTDYRPTDGDVIALFPPVSGGMQEGNHAE